MIQATEGAGVPSPHAGHHGLGKCAFHHKEPIPFIALQLLGGQAVVL